MRTDFENPSRLESANKIVKRPAITGIDAASFAVFDRAGRGEDALELGPLAVERRRSERVIEFFGTRISQIASRTRARRDSKERAVLMPEFPPPTVDPTKLPDHGGFTSAS
jgi:hypothetical protein